MTKRRSHTSSDTGTVRIIAGQYRARRLPVLSLDGLRPSGDRVRETLFNWLQNDVPGARCLDAFAGTGALGFEAASRFAASVTLVESHRSVASELENTRKELGANNVTVVNQRFETYVMAYVAAYALAFAQAPQKDAETWAAPIEKDAETDPKPFDLVFVDPPFHEADFTAVLAGVDSVLAPAGLVYLESPKSLSDADLEIPSSWELYRDKAFGDVRARLYRRIT